MSIVVYACNKWKFLFKEIGNKWFDKLFNKQVDLSKFILLATTSTYETKKLSGPLLSRLNWVNADTAQPKKFFLDRYYYWILGPSLLINLILLTLLLLPKLRKNKAK